eukprot:SAG31_NODE_11774_length_999_cov_1.470000_1_plen_203_part_10
MSDIPVVDMVEVRKALRSTSGQSSAVADQFWNALCMHGCCYVGNHGLELQVERVLGACEGYFALGKKFKKAMAAKFSVAKLGYQFDGVPADLQASTTPSIPVNRECVSFAWPEVTPRRGCKRRQLIGKNQWPDEQGWQKLARAKHASNGASSALPGTTEEFKDICTGFPNDVVWKVGLPLLRLLSLKMEWDKSEPNDLGFRAI